MTIFYKYKIYVINCIILIILSCSCCTSIVERKLNIDKIVFSFPSYPPWLENENFEDIEKFLGVDDGSWNVDDAKRNLGKGYELSYLKGITQVSMKTFRYLTYQYLKSAKSNRVIPRLCRGTRKV